MSFKKSSILGEKLDTFLEKYNISVVLLRVVMFLREINNAKYYNTALAYDFELFMPRTDRAPKIAKQENSKIIRMKEKQKHKSISAFYIIGFIICFLCLILSIFLKSQINETCSEIANVKDEISKAQAQVTELDCELMSIISYSNLEYEATQIGMQKASRHQTHYIKVNQDNVAIIDGKEVVSNKP